MTTSLFRWRAPNLVQALVTRATSTRQTRAAWLAAGLTGLVIVLEDLQLGLGHGSYFRSLFVLHDAPGIAMRAGGWLAVAGLQAAFFWAALLASWGPRLACLVLFAAVTFFEYGYVDVEGIAPTASFVHTVLTSAQYWAPTVAEHVQWTALVPVGLFAAALGLVPAGTDAGRRRFLTVALLTIVTHAAYAVVPLGRGNPALLRGQAAEVTTHALTPVTMQTMLRSVTLFAVAEVNRAVTSRARRPLAFEPGAGPARHVVLVVDESISANRLSVNGYARPTTPWLETIAAQGRVANWGVAAALAPDSDPSVAALLSGLQTVPDEAYHVFTEPTLFHWARAMGFETHLFDGQLARPNRYGLRFPDRRVIDDFRGTREFGRDADTDIRMAHAVRTALARPTPQFIVVLKRGNHFPYTSNYPPEAARWTGVLGELAYDLNEGSANAYDNALRYNLDRFFQGVLEADGTLPGAVLLYTSDHARRAGQLRGGHAVPLLMFGDLVASVDTSYRAGHLNIFPTLLDLMGVPPHARPRPLLRSLLDARGSDRDPRPVLEGDLFGIETHRVFDFDALPRQPPPRPPRP